MRKSVLYSWFGLGGFSRDQVVALQEEGVILLDEGLPGWITERDVRLPGRRSLYKASTCTASLAISQKRIVIKVLGRLEFGLTRNNPRIHDLQVALLGEDRIVLAFSYGLLARAWHGQVQLRLKTAQARRFHDEFTAAGAAAGPTGLAAARGVL